MKNQTFTIDELGRVKAGELRHAFNLCTNCEKSDSCVIKPAIKKVGFFHVPAITYCPFHDKEEA